MKKVENKDSILFNGACKNLLEVKKAKKEVDASEKEYKAKVTAFVQNGLSETEKYKASLSERSRKKVKDEAPALLKEFLGDKEAKKYVVTIDILPEEVIERLVNSGKITKEQGDALYSISQYNVLSVKAK